MADEIEWTPVKVKLGDLSHWADNPVTLTKAQAGKLLRSKEKLGKMQTLAIGPSNGNGKYPLYDGHQRANVWGAAFGMGLEVWALQSSRALTDDERHAVPIMLRTAVGSLDWDALAGWTDYPISEWGLDDDALQGLKFDIAALGNLLESEMPEPADAEPQIDRAEELNKKWQVKTGDLWRIGEHRLLCGDSTRREDVERVMQGERAQLVVTSPPYAVGKEYETETSFDQHLVLLRGVADRCVETVVPGGFIFTNFGEIAAQSHTGPLTGSSRQCIYLISKDYWEIFHVERKCDLYAQRIWYKPFNRLQQPFWSYHTSIPHHQEWEHIWTWRTPGGNGDRPTDWDISVHAVWDTRNEATDDHPLTRHTAAFPVCLPGRAIKAHSIEGEIVFEPFVGSGTTIVACQNLGRKCRAIEISPAYCAVTLERMATAFTGIEIARID